MFKRVFKYRPALLQFTAVLIALAYSNANATSLNEALALSYQTNPEIKSAIKELQSVDEEMPTAISGMLPSTSASIDRGKRNSKTGLTERTSITDTKSIEIVQPLFKGGQTYANIKKAKNEILAAREHFKSIEQQVLLSAVSAYMDVVRDKEFYELAKNNKTVMSRHLESTQARFDLGEVTRTDVAQAKASLAVANSDLISAERSLESSKAGYKRIIGQDPTDVKMPRNLIAINGTIEELIKIALENNPKIKTAQYTWKAAKNDVTAQKSFLLPQVNAFANKERQSGTLISSNVTDSNTIGLSLSIPIYQGGREYAQVRKAKLIAGKNSFDYSVAQNITRESVIKSYHDFRVSQSLIKSNQSNVDASMIALDGSTQEALAGLRTTIDLLDAEHALFNAKSSLIQSKRDEIVSSYTLLAQLGKLTAKDIGLKVDIYHPEKNYNKVKYQIIGF